MAKEVAVGLGGSRKAVGYGDAEPREAAQHLTQRRILAAYQLDIPACELIERDDDSHDAIQLAVDQVKLSPEVAASAYAYVIDPSEGFNKDAQFDMEGFKNVLKLRAEIEGQWGGAAPAPDKYFDLSYYNKAIAGL